MRPAGVWVALAYGEMSAALVIGSENMLLKLESGMSNAPSPGDAKTEVSRSSETKIRDGG